MPTKNSSRIACFTYPDFPNIQSLKLGRFILQSVTIWPAVEVLRPTARWLSKDARYTSPPAFLSLA
jgi:hypothetical protein